MEVLQPTKGVSWTDILTGMQVGQELPPIEMSKRNTVSPLISRHLSLSHPKMMWRTKKLNENEFTVLRVK